MITPSKIFTTVSGILWLVAASNGTAATLEGPISADGTWYTVGAAYNTGTASFVDTYAFSLPVAAKGQEQSVDLSVIAAFFFKPLSVFTWQLDGGGAHNIVSNTIQPIGSLDAGSHTLTFAGSGAGPIGYTGQVAFTPAVVIPLPASWMLLTIGLATLSLRLTQGRKPLAKAG
jgi:hypothetical protein